MIRHQRTALRDRFIAYKKGDDGWWKEQGQALYVEEKSGVPVTFSVVRTRLSGWDNDLIAEQRTTDIYGNETKTADSLDRFNRLLVRRTSYPNSETTAEQVYKNTQLIAAKGKTGHVTKFVYDALGRQIFRL